MRSRLPSLVVTLLATNLFPSNAYKATITKMEVVDTQFELHEEESQGGVSIQNSCPLYERFYKITPREEFVLITY